MSREKFWITLIVAFAIAVIWGYFADIRQQEYGWFVFRLVFVPLVTLLAVMWMERRKIGPTKPAAGPGGEADTQARR